MTEVDNKSNIFGDARAENDHQMLDHSFYEWQDYRTLHEAHDRFIVVGRRGTGKSALTYKLEKELREKKEYTIVIAPNEEEMLGLRAVAIQFGDSVTKIRAGIKLAWRYALLMEIGARLDRYYKTQTAVSKTSFLSSSLKKWNAAGASTIERLRSVLRSIPTSTTPEENIADLPKKLNLNAISEEVAEILTIYEQKYAILTDRLDEGYEPDIIGVGIVDGLIYGTDEIKTHLGQNVRAIIFLRDNIFRAIEEADQDFSRNIEGQVLRLHWDPLELFHLINKRIRVSLKIDQESDIKIWNRYVSDELKGIDGFKKCLRLTLYRPRDLLALMNAAHAHARKQDRQTLTSADIETSAQRISQTRFDDLAKEYQSVFPGIKTITNAFAGDKPKLTVEEAVKKIDQVLSDRAIPSEVIQYTKILGSTEEIVKALYGVGFFGFVDSATNKYIFSHDGKRPDISLVNNSQILIHPCYWIALNLTDGEIDQNHSQDIFDEYEISISSESKDLREKKLGQMMSELATISLGSEGAHHFEDWCKRAIDIAFPKNLTNIELHPNKQHVQRRDVVATNQGLSGVWKRIREDYLVRQVIFEVKNYESIGIEEYRQVSSYLGREYGSLGFIICRDNINELSKNRELEAFREFYSLKNHLIIKLTAKQLMAILSKLRSVQKNDDVDRILDKHIDTHIRLYANGKSTKK
jgi:hypothetical protein